MSTKKRSRGKKRPKKEPTETQLGMLGVPDQRIQQEDGIMDALQVQPFLRQADAARVLGVSHQRIAQLIDLGKLVGMQVGGNRVVSQASVRDRLREQGRKSRK